MQNYGIRLRPQFLMMDFEKSMRTAALKVFPFAKLLGCFFHYSQCLWKWAATKGLRAKDHLTETKKLILLMKIIPHLQLEKRKILFDEIKTKFPQHFFRDFLKYWEKNWLSYEIDMENNIEENERLVRTNNIVEIYNNRVRSKINVKHPRMSILVK